MSVRDLIPWGRSNLAPTNYGRGDQHPFSVLHREMNRMFDDVFRGFDARFPAFGSSLSFQHGWPRIDVSETDSEVRITAEMPGMEEKDIELLLEGDILTIRGEKRSDVEENGKDRQLSERFYGQFERRLSLNAEIDKDKVDASFKGGVLTVVLPKTEMPQTNARRIAIRG